MEKFIISRPQGTSIRSKKPIIITWMALLAILLPLMVSLVIYHARLVVRGKLNSALALEPFVTGFTAVVIFAKTQSLWYLHLKYKRSFYLLLVKRNWKNYFTTHIMNGIRLLCAYCGIRVCD